jgi:DNA gyrase subunit B
LEEKKYTAESIQVLKKMAHVRLRPQMYFQECFDHKNLNVLVLDALCHAVDEYFDDHCNEISIGIEGIEWSLSIMQECPWKFPMD